jgi:tetratricopeptide (TPR) repeat protein
MTRSITAFCAAALLSVGCAGTSNPAAREADSGLAQSPAPAPAKPQGPTISSQRPSLPAVELTDELMFKMMMAEVALQRGQHHVGIPAYIELARETRDPRVAQRATEVAWNARYTDAAIEAAGIWLEAAPGDARARQVLAALLANTQNLETALPHFEKWLSADRGNVGQSFLQLSSLLGRTKDRQAVLALMQKLVAPYRDVAEARLALAQAAVNAGADTLALEESSAALELKPEWELAALFRAQALQKKSSDAALDFLAQYLAAHPQAKDARLNYARLLVSQKRYAEARKQFEALIEHFPDNADVTMAVALLAMQANDFEAAETQLKRALASGYGEPDVARLYLGQMNEERKRYDEALKWYSAVQPGEQYMTAQSRYAGVLAKQGRLAEARKYLRQIDTRNPQQRVQLTQAEAQLLRDANAHKEAFELLGGALAKMPESPELLYDYAMAAEKMDRLDLVESNLRKLIEIRPDHAHAYNALGYTLADRTERLSEAHQLIEKALKLSPDDAFIMDSMGWVLYRMGRNREALEHLERAYKLRPDAEIAAHLGEVLWAAGRQDEARKIWSGALEAHGQNEALQKTVKRYAPVILPAAQ